MIGNKYMYGLILSLVLSSSIYAERLDVEVDGKDCVIKYIRYNDIDNLVWAVGNCDVFYDMCTEDFCKVEKIEIKDLNFGTKDNVGQK